MQISFTCSNDNPDAPQIWEGQIQTIGSDPGEMVVTARGSYFHIIYGQYINGYYLCISNINVGTDLGRPGDIFWNQEHISACYPKLSMIDIISITKALAVANCYMDI